MIAACEQPDYQLMSGWFGGGLTLNGVIKVPTPTYVANLSGGANTTSFITLKAGSGDASFLRYLLVSEVTELFMHAQNAGWFAPSGADEQSCGEALSRFLAQQFLVNNGLGITEPGYALSPSWLNSSLPTSNGKSTQLGGQLTTLSTVINGTVTSISVAKAQTIPFATSYLIQVDAEQMLVTSVNTSNNTLTVTRGHNGTTATAHAAQAPVFFNYGARTDYINLTLEGDFSIDAATGCAMLFLYYLNVQLGFSPGAIVGAAPGSDNAATCLRGVYRNLTGNDGDPFPSFRQLLENAFPPDQVAVVPGPNPDNPWPLPGPSVISGQVTDTALQPINDAFVVFSAAEPITPTTGDSLQLSTDANGQYQTPDIPPQFYQVHAGQDGFVTGEASVTVVPGVRNTTLNFVLVAIEPYTVKGTVTSFQAGWKVTALEGATVTLDIGLHAITDASGSFQFTDQPGSPNPGDVHTLTASMAGFTSSSVTFTIPNGATVTENLVLEPLGSLSGTVVSATGGAPISGATVTAGTASGTSGPDGAYSLTALDPGVTDLAASAPGFDPAQTQVPITPGAHVVQDIAMTPASATLHGTVTSAFDGSPISGATVAIVGTDGAQTDGTGSYTVSHVPAGDHDVTASARFGHFGYKSQTVSIQVIAHQTLRQDFGLWPLHLPKPTGDLPKN